ncbi:hypothetical protein SAMN05216503_0905 [Polaribacter sp. KT25b]|uniref:DUF4870 domain-containing protein n=1 Tax=Polaribacter sp. KT25b TaxID=1855336 RepID=UPI00087A9391|nr:DUF4870 domain-containing protein [Polaribacter sp. KT25b]SDR78735.1 hypothetical protein SAMN05216503_0905 [Polaribacter sp. KT25b]
MKKNNENTNAFLIHISAFAGFIFPFGNIITPLIAWQTLKDRSTFLDEQGKEAVNFNISYTLYVFLLTLTFIPFAFGSIFRNNHHLWNNNHFNFNLNFDNLFGFISFGTITTFIYIIGIALVIIASKKAREGENYKYPFTIKFIK